jgi:hypothetical protein
LQSGSAPVIAGLSAIRDDWNENLSDPSALTSLRECTVDCEFLTEPVCFASISESFGFDLNRESTSCSGQFQTAFTAVATDRTTIANDAE